MTRHAFVEVAYPSESEALLDADLAWVLWGRGHTPEPSPAEATVYAAMRRRELGGTARAAVIRHVLSMAATPGATLVLASGANPLVAVDDFAAMLPSGADLHVVTVGEHAVAQAATAGGGRALGLGSVRTISQPMDELSAAGWRRMRAGNAPVVLALDHSAHTLPEACRGPFFERVRPAVSQVLLLERDLDLLDRERYERVRPVRNHYSALYAAVLQSRARPENKQVLLQGLAAEMRACFSGSALHLDRCESLHGWSARLQAAGFRVAPRVSLVAANVDLLSGVHHFALGGQPGPCGAVLTEQ